MDTREAYERAILTVLEDHLPRIPQPGLQVTLVKDRENGHYQIVHSGWQQGTYSYGSVLHIDLTPDHKVVVLHNGTEAMIADDLHEAGIPKQDIILAFLPRYAQEASGFGVGN
jgi:hypothetical protein